MGTEAIQWIAIGASLMGSATILALKILDRRSSKKQDSKASISTSSGNPGYGERIATLEEAVENIKDDIKEINRKLNRK